jgi:hypothetical protein
MPVPLMIYLRLGYVRPAASPFVSLRVPVGVNIGKVAPNGVCERATVLPRHLAGNVRF